MSGATTPSRPALPLTRGAIARLLLVAASAGLASLTFPPWESWWAAWLCLVPLFLALQRTRTVCTAGWLGLAFGLALFTASLHWMTSIFGAAALSVFVLGSLPWVLFGAAYCWLSKRASPLVVTLMAAVLWLAAEWLRCEGWYFEFSWLQLGLSQVPVRAVREGLYPLVGVYGVTALIALVNAVLASFAMSPPHWLPRFGLLTLGVLLGAAWLHYNVSLRSPHESFGVPILLVQDESSDPSRLKELTLRPRKEKPRLIVWPEYAVADYPLSNPALLKELQDLAQAANSTVVLGCKEKAPPDVPCDWLRRRAMYDELYFNSALVLSPEGEVVGAYHKTHPIQFFKDGVPGRTYPTFDTPVGRLGVAICYDFDFASSSLNLTRNGAELLIVPTFDSMEWGGLQHLQHARIAQARAAEVGRWVLRATSSGLSQVITANGEVSASLPNGVSDSLTGYALRETRLTPYVRGAYVLPKLCVALSLLWLIQGLLREARKKRSPLEGVNNRGPKRSFSRSGFTLIEVLIVVALIGIMAALLFPVFARAKAKARQASCASNLRQLGVALALYCSDYDEVNTRAAYGTQAGPFDWDYWWAPFDDQSSTDSEPGPGYVEGAVSPYVKNNQVLRCPEVPRFQLGYALNHASLGPTFFGPAGVAEAEIEDPSGTLLCIDHNVDPGQPGCATCTPPDFRPHHERAARHNGGLNALFCDGHVKWLKPSQLETRMFSVQNEP